MQDPEHNVRNLRNRWMRGTLGISINDKNLDQISILLTPNLHFTRVPMCRNSHHLNPKLGPKLTKDWDTGIDTTIWQSGR